MHICIAFKANSHTHKLSHTQKETILYVEHNIYVVGTYIGRITIHLTVQYYQTVNQIVLTEQHTTTIESEYARE